MPARTSPTSEQLKRMHDHIGYEWWMLRAAYTWLADNRDSKNVIDINVHVESLAVHGRALIHLFFELEDSRAFDGDVICSDYEIERPEVKKSKRRTSLGAGRLRPTRESATSRSRD